MTFNFTIKRDKNAIKWQIWSRLRHVLGAMTLCAVLLGTIKFSAAAEPDFIPLSEISTGMQGYGLTVFAGSTVDTFGVTVVGIQKNTRVAGSLLLIEVSGHGLERSAIARGMSGSPIYLNGRFAGALAFGWGGALRPIAGVTPAAEMLAMPTHIPTEVNAIRAHVPLDASDLVAVNGETSAMMAEVLGHRSSTTEPAPSRSKMAWPNAPQLWLDLVQEMSSASPGLDASAEQWVFQLAGEAGSGSVASVKPEPLVPGGACAVALITGDAALGAIGTVTWVDGEQVLMMGHPFMQRGPVAWPLATAEVLTIFPSRQMSFKMGSVGQVLGTVHHDMRAGLVGRMGPAPHMVPVEVTIEMANGDERQYSFAVADDPVLTPNLVFWAVYNAMLAAGDDGSRQTLRYEITSEWSGNSELSESPLTLRGVTAGPGGVVAMGAEVATPLRMVLNNPYEEVRLESVHAVIRQTQSEQTAKVVSLTSPRAVASAGETINFQVVVEPQFGARELITIPVTLPDHIKPGPYRVLVASAADVFALDAQRVGGRFQPVKLSGIVDILRAPRSQDSLVLAIFAPGQSAVVQGQEMASLPASVARTVRSGNIQVGRSLADYVYRNDQEIPWALSGHAVRSLRVQPSSKSQAHERRP